MALLVGLFALLFFGMKLKFLAGEFVSIFYSFQCQEITWVDCQTD